jgi:Protein of unknown function (DUF3043)
VAKKAAAEPVVETPAGPGKGRATPSRRQAEQARKRPLVPTDRKQAQRASRGQAAAERERIRIGMQRGEERYLPVRDKGPQRRFVRDTIDARWTVGEFLIPVFVVFFLLTLVIPGAAWLFAPLYGFLALVIIDGLIRAAVIRRRLAQKLGDKSKVERGLNFYVLMRSAQFRSLRMPKPQVKRFAKVE